LKAIVYEGIREVQVRIVGDPAIQNNDDIIVKVTTTSICGSDLHLVHGMIPELPKGFILGHEAVGIVVEKGRDVTRVRKGDRVIIPFPVACGHCRYCRQGLWSQCDNSNPEGETGGIFGYGDMFGGYDGAQAEYLRVPYANVGPVVVPEELSDEQALFLTDILPTSYWGVEMGGVGKDDTVVVLGCGPVGQLAVKWAAFMGAGRIIAADCVGYRLEHAVRYNGIETVNIEEHDDAGEYIREITGGGADVVIDCVGMDGRMTFMEKIETALKLQGGSKSAVEIAAKAVRRGGTVSVLGVYGARYNMFPLGDFFSRNVTLKMGICPVHRYIEPIMSLVKDGSIDPTDIITHRLPLDRGDLAYELFDKKKDNCIKVVLKP